MKIFVSSCLLGYEVRYDGSHKLSKELIEILNGNIIIPGCAELLANFGIPHAPIELKDGHAYFKSGEDVTKQLNEGSLAAYQIYLDNHCDFAILKSKSPSCGRDRIYDGSFNGTMTNGDGALTSIFKEHHIKVFNENELEEIKAYIKNHEN